MSAPNLATLVEHPERAAGLDPSAVPDLLAELEAMRARLWSVIHRPTLSRNGRPAERMLTAAQVAERLGVSTKWVYANRDLLGGKRLSARCVRFPERRVSAYLNSRGS